MNGESRFLWVGEHTALDFVNTERIRQGERVDLLLSWDDFVDWATEAGLVPSGSENEWRKAGEQKNNLLNEIRAFRATLREMAGTIVDTGQPDTQQLNEVNHYLTRQPGSFVVQKSDAGFVRSFMPEITDRGQQILWQLANVTADFVCQADLSQVHRCENPRCILYFLDTTKNHRRRWCSMDACGNQAKAAAFYQRKRQQAKKL